MRGTIAQSLDHMRERLRSRGGRSRRAAGRAARPRRFPGPGRARCPGGGGGRGRGAPRGLLDGPRAQGAFLLKVVLGPPWSLRIADEAPLAIFTVLDGDAWFVHPAMDGPVELAVGDTVVTCGPDHYVVADRPDRAPTLFIGPGGDCRDAAGNHLADLMSLGVRTWGNDPTGSATLLTGAYALDGEVGARLLRALPPALVLPQAEWNSPIAALLAGEIGRDEPGQEAVLDRLLDLLLITALRAWFARPDAEPPAWYAANADPLVGRALQLLHHNPARPWTVG